MGGAGKRTKVDENVWIENAVFLLQDVGGGLPVDELYDMTNTRRTDLADSCLYEHPFLVNEGDNIRYESPLSVKDRDGLGLLFRDMYPEALRRIHLNGIYPYIGADIDDMVRRGELLSLDDKAGSLVWAAHACAPTWPSNLCKAWRTKLP
jgi:hypothetical protein